MVWTIRCGRSLPARRKACQSPGPHRRPSIRSSGGRSPRCLAQMPIPRRANAQNPAAASPADVQHGARGRPEPSLGVISSLFFPLQRVDDEAGQVFIAATVFQHAVEVVFGNGE